MRRTNLAARWSAGLLLGYLIHLHPTRADAHPWQDARTSAGAYPCITRLMTTPPIALWDWDEFKKYWKKQLGRTTGVLGIVTLVMGVGVLIIVSTGKTKS